MALPPGARFARAGILRHHPPPRTFSPGAAPLRPRVFQHRQHRHFHAYHNRQHLYRFSQPIVKRWHQRLHGGIAVSPAAHQYVHNFFPRDYRIIPNGIDVEHFAANAQPWPQYQDGKTNLLFVGRLEKRKGLKYLLAAYSRLKWEYPNLRLIVVGPGNLDPESHQILSARNPADVELVGGVSYQDLPRYYASADIFCSPATGQESFGIVLLEAMAAGKPIVASAIEGYAGIIQNGEQGLLFPRKDPDALADTLATLINDPARPPAWAPPAAAPSSNTVGKSSPAKWKTTILTALR